MSNISKTFMSVDLEFLDPTAHGFIKWVDLDGNSLATLGLGSTAKEIDNDGNITDTGGARYLEWNLTGVDFIKITGGGIQFDEQRSLAIDSYKSVYNEYGEVSGQESYVSSQIELNNPNYKDTTKFEPASILYKYKPDIDGVPQIQDPRYLELKQIKTNYKNNTNALIIEHENTIAFTNPVSKRLVGQIDTVNEAFIWYGAFSLGSVVSDSMFEIKRTDTKYNFTLNASTDIKPEIGFKYEDTLLWSINVSTNNLNLKNNSGWGIELKNSENSVSFTGEIVYKEQTLDERFIKLSGGVMTGNLTSPMFIGSLQGNADSTTKLQTPKTITLVGDVTGSASFDGSSDISITTTAAGHVHDERYYQKSEVYTKTEIDDRKTNILPIVTETQLPTTPSNGETYIVDKTTSYFIYTYINSSWHVVQLT